MHKSTLTAVDLLAKGDTGAAYRLCLGILAEEPTDETALNLLGVALYNRKDPDVAKRCFIRALFLRPDFAPAHNALGNVHKSLGNPELAIDCYRRALRIVGNEDSIYLNLLAVYLEAGSRLLSEEKFSESAFFFIRAMTVHPGNSDALHNYAYAVKSMGRVNESIPFYRRSVAVDYTSLDSHSNISHVLLLTGNYLEGWKEYEWIYHNGPEWVNMFDKPYWDGGDIRGKTLLLIDEGGIGDSFMFARYLPLIADRGGNVVICSKKRLAPFQESLRGVRAVIDARQPKLPHFDCFCSIFSLPGIFRTTVDTIPADIPYLAADFALSAQYASVLENITELRVGICHSSRLESKSPDLSYYAPVFAVEGVKFFCLTRGGREDLLEVAGRDNTFDLGREIDSLTTPMVETGALIANLDLVISVDTSVAHLAGALGKPVWIALLFIPEFRWLLNRDDSPWYPQARLFRQPVPGDWKSVFENMAKELKKLTTGRIRKDCV